MIDAIARLRAQKSRLAAFAFAGNDVLLETDDDGCVAYAAGLVAKVFGVEAPEVLGLPVHDLIAPADILIFDELLLRLRHTQRIDHFQIRVADRSGYEKHVFLCGLTMPDAPMRAYLTMSLAPLRAGRTGNLSSPVSGEEFARSLGTMLAGGVGGEQPKLTLLDLESAARENLAADHAERFIGGAVTYLSAWSAGGAGARRLSDGTVGVLHDGQLRPEAIRNRLNEMVAVFDPTAAPLDIRISELDASLGDMSQDDLAKAIVYAVNAFSKRAEPLKLDSLASGYRAAVGEAVAKVNAFRTAVANNLCLVFQPIVDLGAWQVHHYEALARLDSGGRLMPPAPLIDFAESFGVAEELDFSVVEKALSVLRNNTVVRSGARIAVNLSGRSVDNENFCQKLVARLQLEKQLLPRLKFEVTESHAITDLARANKFLKELRILGCPICIDDFGAGSATFEYLRVLEVDYLKIDGAYVREAATCEKSRAFLRAMVALARDLDIRSIGEMIEDEETMNLLKNLGIHYGQGWFLGKPVANVRHFVLPKQNA